MAQTRSAFGADAHDTVSSAVAVVPPSRVMDDLLGCPRRARPRPTPDPFGRLVARITSGTATPDDLSGLPQGVLRYLDAVTTLCDSGVLDLDRKLEVGDVAVLTWDHAST